MKKTKGNKYRLQDYEIMSIKEIKEFCNKYPQAAHLFYFPKPIDEYNENEKIRVY